MPTVYELARMAKAVYKPVNSPHTPPGWTLKRYVLASGILDGFQAAAFAGPGGLVIAFRGSAQAEDWAVNGAYGIGMNTTRFSQAEDFTTEAAQGFIATMGPGQTIYITGHSLGGAITQIVANRQGRKFVTFNAPGVAVIASRNFDELATSAALGTMKLRIAGAAASAVLHPQQAYRDIKSTFKKAHGLNVCLNADMVSRIGTHYGKVKRIAGPSANPATAHVMDSVLTALQNRDNADVCNYKAESL